MRQRELVGELMDDPGLPEDQLSHALRGLARLNSLSLATGTTMLPLCTLADELGVSDQRPLRVLDVACADGGFVCAASHVSTAHPRPIAFAGCDINAHAIRHAQAAAMKARAKPPQRDAKRPFLPPTFFVHDMIHSAPAGEYDVVMCSLFLHHLSNDHAVRVLRHMSSAAKHMLIVNDLVRSRANLFAVWLASRALTRSPIVHIDATRSVRAAFTRAELRELFQQAGLRPTIRWGGFSRALALARTDDKAPSIRRARGSAGATASSTTATDGLP
jgi:2-polyprenyl-3-methyl-5-hydroxy-6-metoxy-1,4-benzoquinol methylase